MSLWSNGHAVTAPDRYLPSTQLRRRKPLCYGTTVHQKMNSQYHGDGFRPQRSCASVRTCSVAISLVGSCGSWLIECVARSLESRLYKERTVKHKAHYCHVHRPANQVFLQGRNIGLRIRVSSITRPGPRVRLMIFCDPKWQHAAAARGDRSTAGSNELEDRRICSPIISRVLTPRDDILCVTFR